MTTSGTPDFYSVVGIADDPCEGTLYAETAQGFAEPGAGKPDLIFAIYVTTKAECKKGGYKDFGYTKQSQCIKAVKSSPKQRTS